VSLRYARTESALARITRSPAFWFVLAAIAWTLFRSRNYWPNNFIIYRTASGNLLAGRDLYLAYPARHFDLFKYSPTFALIFLPFAALPMLPALLLWNVFCTALFAWAVAAAIPRCRHQLLAFALLLLPYMSQLGGAQTNGLVTAVMIIAAIEMERRRGGAAAICVAGGAAVKLFPLAIAPLALMHPRKARFAVTGIVAAILFAATPALVVGMESLIAQYRSWLRIEAVDSLDRGHSVMGMMHDWLGYSGPNWTVQLAGTIVLLLPIALRRSRWPEIGFRRWMLASVLIYVVLFNHQAERQSYLIAATGLVLWFLWSRRTPLALLATALAMIALHPFPYLLIWLLLQFELLRRSGAEVRERDVVPAEAFAHG
jgi:Glycosyltransferase family 87